MDRYYLRSESCVLNLYLAKSVDKDASTDSGKILNCQSVDQVTFRVRFFILAGEALHKIIRSKSKKYYSASTLVREADDYVKCNY